MYIWATCCLKSSTTWLFVQQCVHVNIKEIIKAQRYWPFVKRIVRWLVVSTHQGPIMPKSFSCHDAFVDFQGFLVNTKTPWSYRKALRTAGPLWGEPPTTGGFLPQKTINAEFWCFHWWQTETLGKQPICRWFQSSWCSSDVNLMSEGDSSVVCSMFNFPG